MGVGRHRIAAGAILVGATLALVGVGRSLVADSALAAATRSELDGKWVATRVETPPWVKAEGAEAGRTTAEFDRRHVRFRGLVDATAADGVFNLEPTRRAGQAGSRVDFKVDAGWLRGVVDVRGDTLMLCVNALRPPEQLGVPTQAYPTSARPAMGRIYYEFRRVASDHGEWRDRKSQR